MTFPGRGRRALERLRPQFWVALFVASAVPILVIVLGWTLSGRSRLAANVGILQPLLGLFLFGVVVSGLRLARRSMILWTAVLVLVSVGLARPWHAVSGCGSNGSAIGDLTVYSANVELGFGRPIDVAAEAVAQGADLIALQEVSPGFLAELERQPGIDQYRHRVTDPRVTTEGVALYSRYPLEGSKKRDLGGSAPMIESTVETPQGDIVVHLVHTSAPTTGLAYSFWQDQFVELAEVDHSQPSVIVGDLNAWSFHQPFRNLTANGWTDATTVRRCGLAGTWPARGIGSRLSPLELDHVLVSDHVEVIEVARGQSNGSDHRSLITSLRYAR